MAVWFSAVQSPSGRAEKRSGGRSRHKNQREDRRDHELTNYRSINALAEAIYNLYKTELIRRQGPWRNAEHVELATLAYVDWSRYAGDPCELRVDRSGWVTWPSRLVWSAPGTMAVA